MRRNIKKLLCVMMIMIMSVSVMACGSKSKSGAEKLSAEEIYTKMAEASKDVEGMTGKANFDVVVSLGGTEMPFSGNMEVKTVTEPIQAFMKLETKVSLLGQEQTTNYEMYEVTSEDGNSIETFLNNGQGWEYESVDIKEDSELAENLKELENVKELMSSVDYSEVVKYFDKIKAKTSGDNYVINMEVSSDKLIEKVKETEYGSYLEEADISKIPNIVIKGKVTVDSKTFLPKSMTFSVGSMEIENAYEGMNVELKKCEFTYTYESFEKPEIVVPEEALDAKNNYKVNY